MHLLSLTLALPLLASGSLETQADTKSAPDSRRFDLRSFELAAPSVGVGVEPVMLLPLMRSPRRRVGSEEGEEFEWNAAQALVTLFSSHYGDSITTIDFDAPGIVNLVAPESTLAKFEEYVAFFESALFSAPSIEIVRFATAEEIPTGRMSREALASAFSTGAVLGSKRIASLPSGGVQRAQNVVLDSVVGGVGGQIAQGMAIIHNETVELETGMSLYALSGPASATGTKLCYALVDTERVDQDNEFDAGTSIMLTREQGGTMIESNGYWSETYGVSGGVVAGEVTLSDDEVLVLSVRVSAGALQYVAVSFVPDSTAGGRGRKMSTGTGRVIWAGPRTRNSVPTLRVDAERLASSKAVEHEVSEGVSGNSTPLTALIEFAHSPTTLELDRSLQSARITGIPGAMIVDVAEAESEALDRWIAGSAQDSTPLSVRVDVQHARNAAHQALFAIDSGAQSVLVVGKEGLMAKADSVEVAQFSGLREPEVVTHFEGMAATIRLSRLANGGLAYSVHGQICADLKRAQSKATSSGATGLVATQTSYLVLADRGVAKMNAGGGWTIVLGDISGNTTTLTLNVR